MNAMLLMLFVGALATTLLIRVMPLILFGRPDLSTGDVINHLNLIDGFRANRHRIPDFREKFLLTDKEDYPTLYHWLLSFLPQRVVDHLEPVFGPLVETVHAGMLFVFAWYFGQLYFENEHAAHAAFAATMMFAATPLLLGIENYGRVFRLSARPVGVLLTATHFLSVVCFLHSGSLGWLVVGGIAAGLVALSSYFGVQAIVFITSLLCIMAIDFRPMLMLPIGVVFGTLVSRGHLLRILRGCIHHSYFYCTYLTTRHPATTDYTIRALVLWPLTLIREPKRALRLLATHYFFISFTLFPWSIVLGASYWMHPVWVADSPRLEQLLLLWYVAGLISMLVTITPWCRFLGEGSRYVIHSVTPVCILAAYRLLQLNDQRLWWLCGSMALVSIFGLGCNYWISFLVRKNDEERLALYRWVKEQPPSCLLTIDLRLSFLMCFRTDHRTVNFHINAPRGDKLKDYKELITDAYPWPNADLAKLIDRYHVDLIVVDKTAAASFVQRSGGKHYDFSSFVRLYESNRFTVYGCRQLAQIQDERSAA